MLCVVCVSILYYPPFVFIGGRHGQQGCLLQLFLQEPTYSSNEQAPRGRLKLVGPMGWLADQGGLLATQWAQPTLAFFSWVEIWAHLSLARG